MAATVELNGETRVGAVKIKDVMVDWVLPAKFPALKLPIAKMTP